MKSKSHLVLPLAGLILQKSAIGGKMKLNGLGNSPANLAELRGWVVCGIECVAGGVSDFAGRKNRYR